MAFDSDYFWILSLNALLHELGIPLPLTPAALAAGAAAMMHGVSPLPVLAAVVIASLAGNAAWYYAGRRYGSRVLAIACRASLSRSGCVTRAESAFRRWGVFSLLLGRFMPGVSLVAPPLAGALGMPLPKFVALSVTGATLWSTAVVGTGMLFAEEIGVLLAQLPALG